MNLSWLSYIIQSVLGGSVWLALVPIVTKLVPLVKKAKLGAWSGARRKFWPTCSLFKIHISKLVWTSYGSPIFIQGVVWVSLPFALILIDEVGSTCQGSRARSMIGAWRKFGPTCILFQIHINKVVWFFDGSVIFIQGVLGASLSFAELPIVTKLALLVKETELRAWSRAWRKSGATCSLF